MANNLDDIVRVVIDLNAPPGDSAGFNNLLILCNPPSVKRNDDGTIRENDVPAVGVYSDANEVNDVGFSTIGDDADPAGAAARIAFSQSPPPNKVYIAVRQRTAFDPALFSAYVTNDISGMIGGNASEGNILYFVAAFPATSENPVIEKNGNPYSNAVSVTNGDVKYSIITLQSESNGIFQINLPEWMNPDNKTIALQYVVKWTVGSSVENIPVQTVNKSDFENMEDTLSRAASMDGWYCLCPAGIDETYYSDIASWIETQEKIACFPKNDSIAQTYYRSFVIAHDENGDGAYANIAYPARFLSYQAGSETWAYKTLAGITPEYPTGTEKKAYDESNISYYTQYANRNVVIGGKVSAGEWIDTIRFRDWLKNDMQIRIMTLLFVHPKLPYTDNGIAMVKNQMIASLKQGQKYGGIAETEYDSDGNEIQGFQVSVPLAADITPTQKQSRILADCNFAARLAGAIHAVNIHGALVYNFDGGTV
jgi:hypothetical protein